jgi:lysozyme
LYNPVPTGCTGPVQQDIERKEEMSDKPIFDAIRARKGAALSQADVDAVNGVMYPRATGAWHLSPTGAALIHEYEDLKLVAYKDPGSRNGLPITNGWGTTVDEDGGPIKLGAVWTREKADRLWLRDQKQKEEAVSKLVEGYATTQAQFDALVSFAYNAGEGADGLAGSTLLRKHRAGDFAGAKAEFGRWIYNDGKVMAGLIRRRAAEAALYGAKA